jgi:hypothetical protein
LRLGLMTTFESKETRGRSVLQDARRAWAFWRIDSYDTQGKPY